MVRWLWAGVLAVVVSTNVAAAEPNISGSVEVIDGDTLDVGGQRVRLHGIDAPENDQTCETEQGASWNCGAWVTKVLRERYQGAYARCTQLDTDRYYRAVATCSIKGQDVGGELVSDGLAFAYRKYSMDYDLAEKQAAVRDVGLHASNIQSPSHFRQTRAVGRIPPDRTCRIKGNISTKGTRIYHMPGQRDYERTGIREEKGERWFCSTSQAEAAGWRAARR